MAKDAIIDQAVSDIQAGIVEVMKEKIGAAIDQAVAEVAPAPVGFTQEDIDAAVAAVKSEMQAKVDEIAAKEASEEQKLEAIKALLAG